jgi:hypothetical protein
VQGETLCWIGSRVALLVHASPKGEGEGSGDVVLVRGWRDYRCHYHTPW